MYLGLGGSSINFLMSMHDITVLKTRNADLMTQEAPSNLVSSNGFFYHLSRGNRSVVPEQQVLEKSY